MGVFKEAASGAKNDRAERKKVMAFAQTRKIDAILVTELSRWGRSTQDLGPSQPFVNVILAAARRESHPAGGGSVLAITPLCWD
jgi:hypothetical protein